jgi:hypothetical protein
VRYLALVSLILCVAVSESATAAGVGSYFVTAPEVEVRLGSDPSAKVTNRLYRGTAVEVMQIRGDWARISKYYDGGVEGLNGRVARWIPAQQVSKQRPSDAAPAEIQNDSRISGLPEPGDGGLTKADIAILYRGAKHFLDSGQCKLIEYGDKSTSKANNYFVNCGEPRNRFFKPSDLPVGSSPASM